MKRRKSALCELLNSAFSILQAGRGASQMGGSPPLCLTPAAWVASRPSTGRLLADRRRRLLPGARKEKAKTSYPLIAGSGVCER